MASDTGCSRGPAAPSFSAAGPRVGSGSPRRRRPFVSLRGRSDVRRVRRIGSRRSVGGVTVLTASGVPGAARVAVVAGRRVGGAVERNRTKRRLREAVARARIRTGVDYIIIGSREALEASFEDLLGWVRRAVE
jgi:ribonuclease P protein component